MLSSENIKLQKIANQPEWLLFVLFAASFAYMVFGDHLPWVPSPRFLLGITGFVVFGFAKQNRYLAREILDLHRRVGDLNNQSLPK